MNEKTRRANDDDVLAMISIFHHLENIAANTDNKIAAELMASATVIWLYHVAKPGNWHEVVKAFCELVLSCLKNISDVREAAEYFADSLDITTSSIDTSH
jgi:hypothetical protein